MNRPIGYMENRPICHMGKRDIKRPGFIRAHLGRMGAVRCFPRNERGRDFVVGDIHGMFDLVDTLLKRLKFNSGQDRLFAVGDLFDPGRERKQREREPDRALKWIRSRSWFHSVRGNHEQFLLDVAAEADGEKIEGPLSSFFPVLAADAGGEKIQNSFDGFFRAPAAKKERCFWRGNGGIWWSKASEETREAFVKVFARLPFAIQIDCEMGLTGVVHADVPEDLNWNEFCMALYAHSRPDIYHTISSTRRHWNTSRQYGPAAMPPVIGIKHVICGHIRAKRGATQLGNMWNIDTGAAYGGWLTIGRIHPGPLEWFPPLLGRDSLHMLGFCGHRNPCPWNLRSA